MELAEAVDIAEYLIISGVGSSAMAEDTFKAKAWYR
jgi:hypothetical protein